MIYESLIGIFKETDTRFICIQKFHYNIITRYTIQTLDARAVRYKILMITKKFIIIL